MNLKHVIMGATFGKTTSRNDGEKQRSRQGTCVYTRVVVEAPPPLLATPTPARGPNLEPKATASATAAAPTASRSLVTTMERSRGLVHLNREVTGCCVPLRQVPWD